MKKAYTIKLSYNVNVQTHSLKRIVGYYYNEYIELNDKFENMSEDEYSKIMIAKGNSAKTKKERDKIAKEYSENMEKYYSHNSHTILTYNNQVNKLNGYIGFKYEEIEEQFELPLLDFISYNLNNVNEYIIFFINYFDIVSKILDKEIVSAIKLNTLYEIKYISDIARTHYDKVVKEVKKMQMIFKKCIDLIYQINTNDYTSKLSKGLTREQRFFVFNQVNNKPFKDISNNFKTINSLDYSYKYIDSTIPELIISLIKTMDPNGTDISHSYQYETDNLYTAFYIMLYDIISINNWYVKICGNCGRYFLTPKATVAYCDRFVDGELTCRDVGNKEYQKRKLEKDTTYEKYRKIGSRKQLRANRNPEIDFYKEDLNNFRKIGKQMYKALCSKEISSEEFAKWVDEQDK